MTNSSENSTGNCLSGLLRRLLCSGSLPTEHKNTSNFDHQKSVSKNQERASRNEDEKKASHAATPNIVARLMGLDSMPDSDMINWTPKQRSRTTLESILRSRSVNSLSYLREFESARTQTRAQHRRVKTSVSFREVPTYFRQENHEFLVLCFERAGGGTGGSKMSLSVAEAEVGSGEVKQRKAERWENFRERKFEEKRKKVVYKKKQEPVDRVNLAKKNRAKSATLKGKGDEKRENHKKISTSELRNKKRNRNSARKVEPLCNLDENSTPDSLLQHQNSHQSILPEDSNGGASKMMKEEVFPISTNCGPSTFLADDHALRTKEKRSIDKPITKAREENHCYSNMVSEIYRLTKQEIQGANWRFIQFITFEQVEEICAVFGQQILDSLLHQVIDELLLCNDSIWY